MKSIKIAYQSTVRRFSVSDTVTWPELESSIRELFSLSLFFNFSLSYTDEDGDIITLSTDMELQEFLSSQSSKPTLKFTLVPEKQQLFVTETLSSNTSESDFVSIEKEKFISENTSEKPDKHDIVMNEVDEVLFNPTIPSVSKGKQKDESLAESFDESSAESSTESSAESSAESSTYATNRGEQEEKQEQPSSDNDENKAPFIELAEQFQKLLDQFHDVLSNQPQLVDQANVVMDQILHNVPVDIDQWAQWLNSFRPEGNTSSTNTQEGESNNSRGEQQQRRRQQSGEFCQFGQFPPFFPPPNVLFSNPWVQQFVQDVSTNYPEGFENFAKFMGGYPQQQRRQQQQQQQQQQDELNQESLKEKIDLLHSMGFWEDDVKNEELLKKYNGNVDKVVEILIEQTKRNNNDSYNNNSTEDGQ